MQNYFISIILSLSSLLLSAQQDYPQGYFTSPIESPIILAGTFGELRGNHFHSGIDIKTRGRINMPILAAAEGYISRIKVSPYGFGKALYVRHPNGYTTVYAHLESFDPLIEAYLKAEQKRTRSNAVDLFPRAGQLSFQQGEQIALSGNTGGSGGPHLHFEVRSTATEKIINPLLFGLAVSDDIHPELSNLQVYTFDEGEVQAQEERSLLHEGNGNYSLSGNGIVEVQDDFTFGIHAIDKLNGASNRNGVYELKLYINDEINYHFQMETYAFSETRYINSHIDFALKDCCGRVSHKLYLEPNNQLSVYPLGEKGGIISFNSDTLVDVRIEAADFAGNVSVLDFKLNYQLKAKADENVGELPLEKWAFQKAHKYENQGLSLSFKPGSFYRDIYFEHQVLEPSKAFLSDVHQVGSTAIPVQRYYNLGISLKYLDPKWDPKKLCIVGVKNNRIIDYEGGTYALGSVRTRTRNFGDFAVTIDTIAPSIRAINFSSGASLNNKSKLLIEIKDELSGIKEYNAWIGDQWWPLYYDAKNDRLILSLEDLSKETGKHSLRLVVEDDKKNQSEENWELIVP